MIELQLLNTLLAKRDLSILERHKLSDPSKWHNQRSAYEFITQHVAQYGETPSVETVVANVDGFDALEVVESAESLCRRMVELNAKADMRQLLTSIAANFSGLTATQMVESLRSGMERIAAETGTGQTISAIDWTTTGAERFAEMERRERRENGTALPILFPELAELLGAGQRGDYIAIMAATSRGKTWLGQLQALACNHVGERVLFESGEMGATPIGFRFDTLESGISNRGIYNGTLDDEQRAQYQSFTDGLGRGNGRTPLFIKTSEDWPNGLTIRQLEADIRETDATVVIIDQFNLMRAKSSDNSDKALLSRQIKQLANRLGVMIVVLCQTNGDYLKKNPAGASEDGIRALKLPTLSDYSETIAIQQDADIFIGFDAVTFLDGATGKSSGKALIGILKGRNGGAGSELELTWCPDYGVITPRVAMDIF